jgi:hypothetical protein
MKKIAWDCLVDLRKSTVRDWKIGGKADNLRDADFKRAVGVVSARTLALTLRHSVTGLPARN